MISDSDRSEGRRLLAAARNASSNAERNIAELRLETWLVAHAADLLADGLDERRLVRAMQKVSPAVYPAPSEGGEGR